MSKLIKYGGFRKRMMKKVSEEPNLKATMNVPNKFLETEGRKKFQQSMTVIGIISFIITATIVATMLTFLAKPSLLPENLATIKPSTIAIPLFLMNLMGLFVTAASDGVGTNWFARSILLMAGLLLLSLIIV